MSYQSFASYYDALTANINYAQKAAWLNRLIAKHTGRQGGILLDLACGTGSLSLAFSKLGYDVIGVDGSEDMLAVAAGKAAGEGRDILFLCQLMEELDLYGTVDHAVCVLDSLNHLQGEDALNKVMERLSLFVAPGGLLLFDVNTAYKHKEILGENTFVYDLPGIFCVWQNQYCPEDGSVDIDLDFFEKVGQNCYSRHIESFAEQLFTEKQIRNALKRNQFEVLNILDGDEEEAPRPESQRLLYLAKRREG